MIDVNINVVAHELDPTKKYILEVRRGDLAYDDIERLSRGLKEQLGVANALVISETGSAIKVNQIPEEVAQ